MDICCAFRKTYHRKILDMPWIILLCIFTDRLKNRQVFVCVEVLRPSQPNGVMSSAVFLPNHTCTGQTMSSMRLTSIVHILSPETDNCPSWFSGRERMTVENISWSNVADPAESNPQPPDHQSDAHASEPSGLIQNDRAICASYIRVYE